MATASKILTQARDLQRRKARERREAFVAEGIRTVEALLASPLRVRALLASSALATTPRGAAVHAAALAHGIPVEVVDEAAFASAADTEAPQGVLAIADLPRHVLGAPPGAGARYLILDGVQDPGNAGTIIRSAEAFGATALFALRGTVDFANPKLLRASSGSIFRLPVFRGELSELKLTLYGAAGDAGDAGKLAKDVDWRGPCAIVIGSEGQGLSEAVRKATQPVRIPTQGVESLNAAIAAAVFLYEAARQRGEAE